MDHFGRIAGAATADVAGTLLAPSPFSIAMALLLVVAVLLWLRERRLHRRERGALLLRSEQELAALEALVLLSGRSTGLRETLHGAAGALQNLYGKQCEVAIFDFAGGETILASSRGDDSAAADAMPAALPADDFQRTEFRAAIAQSLAEVGGALRECMAAEPAALVTEADAEWLPAEVLSGMRRAGCSSWMAAALHAQGKIAGVLLVAKRGEGGFLAGEAALLRVIARQLGSAVEKTLSLQETERACQSLREAQEQLLQSEKMSAVGMLIAGVAHEVNNPLTAILGYAQLMESEELSGRARDFLQKLHRQAQRTQRVVQDLLSFSRPSRPMRSQVDLRRVLDTALTLRDLDLERQKIAVETDCEAGLPMILGDEHQLEQVFLNIVHNAVDSILETGHEGVLRIRLHSQQDLVCAEFRDNGTGIKEPAKIFDPFYTTKKIGRGSGLGLSICYGIVKEHEGEILAANLPDGGASFVLKFPAAQSMQSSDSARATRNPAC